MNWLYLWLSYALGQISALGIIWLGHIMLSENDSNSGKSIFEKKQAD